MVEGGKNTALLPTLEEDDEESVSRIGSRVSSANTSRKTPAPRLHASAKFHRTSLSRQGSNSESDSETLEDRVLITEVQETEEQSSNVIDELVKNVDDELSDDDLPEDKHTEGTEPQEVDYDTDLEIDGEEWVRSREDYDPSGGNEYIRECNELGVVPVSYFMRHIQDKQFAMRYHGLGPLGAKAIAKPLVTNTSIEKLNLEGNHIEGDGAAYLCKVLKDNLYITELVLAENQLGSQGARVMSAMIQDNVIIQSLDLSANNFKDEDAESLCHALESNGTLRRLYLHHNKFEAQGAKYFRDVLANSNESLRELDLSWNHFRLKGAKYLGELIKENYGLKRMNLSWNGLGIEGAKAIGDALKHNNSLVELDISSNRILSDGAVEIARGLAVNDVLEVLKVGKNPLRDSGALSMLTALDRNESSSLVYMDLTAVVICADGEKLEEKIKETRNFTLVHGGVEFKKPSLNMVMKSSFERAFDKDPMTKLKRYAEDEGLRLIDLFRQFDKDNSMTVSREEFVMGVESTGINMMEEEIEALIDRLDKDGDGEIDYGELLFGDKENRKVQRQVKKIQNEEKEKIKEIEKADPFAQVVVVRRSLDNLA